MTIPDANILCFYIVGCMTYLTSSLIMNMGFWME